MKKGQASSTAILIAKSTVTTAEHRHYGRFVPRHARLACAWFLEDHLTLGRLRLALYRQAWNRRFQRAFESLTLPGIQLHYALRKAQLEKYARQSLESDTLQVVVPGSRSRLFERLPAILRFSVTGSHGSQQLESAVPRPGGTRERTVGCRRMPLCRRRMR